MLPSCPPPLPLCSRLEANGAVAAGTTFRVAKIPNQTTEEKRAYAENVKILRAHAAVFPTGADLKVASSHPAIFR